jgi:2-polyprenyl-3-methyl-5-hydroxy-6-metoxy-1,4-benzoquinol methylase
MVCADEGNLVVNRCLSCGFVYLASWQRSLEQSEELYDYYGRLNDEDLARRYSSENRARQQTLLKRLANYSGGRTLLDVGCGDGQLLQTAKDEGWDALGIDLSETAIMLCHRRGLSASRTDFFDVSLDKRRFDVIVMSELIEHVPSPQRFLKRAEELLEEGGVVYLTTPNFGSLARRVLAERWSVIHPEHIGYFERSTLRKLASKETGLVEIKIEANNITPSTFVAWLRRSGRRTVAAASQAHRETRQGLDQQLRRAVHDSSILGMSKELLNHVISRFGLGDTLVAYLQKPERQA